MIDVIQAMPVSADKVWQRIRDFGDLSWLPGVSACDVDGNGLGAIRTVSVGDGPPVQERLEAHDDETRQFSYSIISAPGLDAQASFHASVSVTPTEDGCEVRWQAGFNREAFPPEVAEKLTQRAEGMYRACLTYLANQLQD